MYFLVNTFLSLYVTLEKIYNYGVNTVYDYLDNVTVYTTVHDLSDPFVKTYSVIFVPTLFSYDVLTCKLMFVSERTQEKNVDENSVFYERCVIKDRGLRSYYSKLLMKKPVSDFKSIKQLSMKVNDTNVTLHDRHFDFDPSADHLCVIMAEDLGSEVQCVDNNLDEITFKDIDTIN